MNRFLGILLLIAAATTLASSARAALPASCTALDADERAAVDRVMKALYPHDCCDRTLAACAADEKPSRLVRRLSDAVCRKLGEGRSEDDVRGALERRAASMVAVGKPADIDLENAPAAGAGDAPVTVVVFACARCPFCSKAVPALHEDITTGPLAGKVRLAFKVFPVRGHAGSTEGALAFAAAHAMGAFWPFVLRAYGAFDDFSADRLGEWARAVGLDRAAFEARAKSAETREAVVASKKEGLRVGVEATPTLFIDGHRYRGDLDRDTLRDVLLEAWERKQGLICQP